MNEQDLLAKRIINFREAENMSQAELADKAHIERTALNKIEKGTRKVSSDELRSIALALNQSTDVLLDLNEKTPKNVVDLDKDPIVLSYDGKPVSKEDMEIIKAILERHKNE